MLVDKNSPVLGVILWFPIFSSPAARRLIVTSYSWGRPLLWASRSPVHPGLGPVSHPYCALHSLTFTDASFTPILTLCLSWLLIPVPINSQISVLLLVPSPVLVLCPKFKWDPQPLFPSPIGLLHAAQVPSQRGPTHRYPWSLQEDSEAPLLAGALASSAQCPPIEATRSTESTQLQIWSKSFLCVHSFLIISLCYMHNFI